MARQTRIGSLSLGLGLVAFGTGMLVEANGGPRLVDWLLRVWPALLVITGVEVLWRSLGPGARDDWHLDVASMFVLAVLVASTAVGYAAVRLHPLHPLHLAIR